MRRQIWMIIEHKKKPKKIHVKETLETKWADARPLNTHNLGASAKRKVIYLGPDEVEAKMPMPRRSRCCALLGSVFCNFSACFFDSTLKS